MKQIKSPILGIAANGFAPKKCEVYQEENSIFLMSHNSKWNKEGLQPEKMHSWKCAALICESAGDNLNVTIAGVEQYYKKAIEEALNITIDSIEAYQVKKADDAVKDDAPLKKDDDEADAPLQPAPLKDDAPVQPLKKDDAPLKKDDAPLKKDDAAQPLKGLQGAALAGDKMQMMQMMMQMMMQPAGISEEALQMIQDLKNQNESLMNALDAYKVRIEALENNAPTRIVHEFKGYSKDIVKIEGEVYHKNFDKILKVLAMHIAVYLFGPAGSGKNVLAEQIAKALGVNFYYSNSVTQEFKVTGHSDINGNLVETEFYKAFTEGGLFMLDEVDSSDPNALIVLNAALANGYFDFPVVGKKMMHKDFYCIAAGNTKGTGATLEYSSRFIIDEATRDRFCFFEVDYDENIEKSIVKAFNGDDDILPFVYDIRKSAKKNQIHVLSGNRLIKNLAKLTSAGLSVKDAVLSAFFDKYNKDDIRILAGDLLTYNNKYTEALKRLAA